MGVYHYIWQLLDGFCRGKLHTVAAIARRGLDLRVQSVLLTPRLDSGGQGPDTRRTIENLVIDWDWHMSTTATFPLPLLR